MKWTHLWCSQVPSLCPPLPHEASPFPQAPDLSALFLTNPSSQTESTLPMESWSKGPRIRSSLRLLPDEHLGRFLPLMLKRDHGLLQSCLTELLTVQKGDLGAAHGPKLVMTTGLSSQVGAVDPISSLVQRGLSRART